MLEQPVAVLQVSDVPGPAGRVFVGRVDAGASTAILRLVFEPGFVIDERSAIEIVSVLDGAKQRLTAKTITEWSGMSSAFNGSAVDVFVEVAGDDDRTSFRVERVMTLQTARFAVRNICGLTDERVPSSDPAVARLALVCTCFMTTARVFVTAGHCDVRLGDIVEFNVPQSWADGTPRVSAPEDQYPIVWFQDSTASSSDWSIFRVAPTTEFRPDPFQRYHTAYRLGTETSESVRCTGYGVDISPVEPPNYRNEHSQTQQVDVGQFAGIGYLKHTADTLPGSAGSPLTPTSRAIAIAMHTYGSNCGPGDLGNVSQPMRYGASDLAQALQNAVPPGVIFVDAHSLDSGQTGGVFQPWESVNAAASRVAVGGRIWILSANYDETITINRACTLEAPFGTVTIGRP